MHTVYVFTKIKYSCELYLSYVKLYFNIRDKILKAIFQIVLSFGLSGE